MHPLEIRERDGRKTWEKPLLSQRFLYHTLLGRIILSFLIKPSFSKKIGKYLDSPKSIKRIDRFIKKNHIVKEDYVLDDIHSFNDFFSRQIKEGKRILDSVPQHLISPCDGKVTYYPIGGNLTFPIKNSIYRLSDFVDDEKLVSSFQDGSVLVLRLSVDDYHRYCYLDDGTKEENVFLKGVLHTVNPIANDRYKIYVLNQREYTVLHTAHFSDVIQIEVGALLVGKIANIQEKGSYRRGEEKGKFLYGGSTIVLLLHRDVHIDEDIIKNSKEGAETRVRMGEKIGYVDA